MCMVFIYSSLVTEYQSQITIQYHYYTFLKYLKSQLYFPYTIWISKNRSVIQQLLILFNKVINTTHQTDLDFQKAFNSAPHDELLLKLNHLGVSGNGCMILHTTSSTMCVINTLIFYLFYQGFSILGPFLFFVYIN